MEINKENIKSILVTNNIVPSKNRGQNFLINPEIANEIVSFLDLNTNENVIEIGPGLGSLSHYLTLSHSNITLLDIDYKVIDFLTKNYIASDKLEIVCNDALKYELGNYDKLISNIPYNITTPLIEHILLTGKNLKKVVLMTQSEVFDRLNATRGSEYCPLSILIRLLGKIEKKLIVKGFNFYPVPKCSSTVFSIDINNRDEDIFQCYKYTKIIFNNRRKTIYNNLLSLIKDKKLVDSVLEKLGIDKNKRPEEIEYQDYLKMTKIILGHEYEN